MKKMVLAIFVLSLFSAVTMAAKTPVVGDTSHRTFTKTYTGE